MKKIYLIAALTMGLTAVACNSQTAEENAESAEKKVMTAKDYIPSKAEVDSVSYLMGINFGSFLKSYNFGELNYNQVLKGMKAYVNAKGDEHSEEFLKQFKYSPMSINNAFNSYLEKRNNYESLVSKEESEKFLAANAKKDGVKVTESGLQYEIIEQGGEVMPTLSDTLYVKYKGTLIDGTVFDQTAEDGEPISFPLGGVIKGWQEGLQLIGEGGKIKLYIPADLAYGERGNQGERLRLKACTRSSGTFGTRIYRLGPKRHLVSGLPGERRSRGVKDGFCRIVSQKESNRNPTIFKLPCIDTRTCCPSKYQIHD